MKEIIKRCENARYEWGWFKWSIPVEEQEQYEMTGWPCPVVGWHGFKLALRAIASALVTPSDTWTPLLVP